MERPVLVRHGALVLRQLPPGFRFHPTDEELVVQYLRRKALAFPLPAAVIPEIHDLYSFDPWDLPGASEGEKYFFTLRGAGYRRATGSGYWKVTGREKPIVASRCGSNHLVGVKRALVFHHGRPPRGSRTDWVMHEYRLAVLNWCCSGMFAQRLSKKKLLPCSEVTCAPCKTLQSCLVQPKEWMVCRIFQKNNNRSRRPDEGIRQMPSNHAFATHHMTQPSLSMSSSSSSQ